MTRILYGVSPIGLGHASRAVAIGLKLSQSGFDVEFATGGAASAFLRSYRFKVHDVVSEPIPAAANGTMKRPSVWYLKYWYGYRSTRRKMNNLLERFEPEIVIGDEEFASVSIAIEKGIKHVLISDELELGFARGALSRYVEERVSRWYANLQRNVSHLVVPDFGMDAGNTHYVTPVVRDLTMTREQVRASLKIDPKNSFVLFSASGSGISRFLLDAVVGAFEKLGLPNGTLVVSGLKDGPAGDNILYRGFERDNQNLVAAADLVISTAGKSTIDEATSSGTPMIAIPIKNHFEQERNAKALGYSFEDITRMDALMSEKLGKRTEPGNYQGAENVRSYIMSL